MASEKLCERALEAHEGHLGLLPNVVGLGIVLEDEADPAARDLAVAVYVTKKLPKEDLEPVDRIPRSIEVRDRRGTHTVPVRVIEQGEVELESPSLEGLGLEMPGKDPL